MEILNIASSALHRSQFTVMFNKVWLRFFDKKSSLSKEENLIWLSQHKIEMAVFCQKLDEKLWHQIQHDIDNMRGYANSVLIKLPFDLGGGGAYPLAHFIVRLCKPDVVVETGVAAGFSSYGILEALDKNNKGHLYSSDFPYFRLPNPIQFIGVVVPNHLRNRWSLYVDGDTANLKKINKLIPKIDVFHYDSDKSYMGRAKALKSIQSKLNEMSWLIFDDIQDNSFFHDLVKKSNDCNWAVFEFEGKWVGLIFPDEFC